MKQISKYALGLCALLQSAQLGLAAGAPPAGPGETHVAYEMAIYEPAEDPQRAGTHLNAPGDSYRYTYIIDDKYAGDKDYVLKRALFGVHIIDPDYTKENGDGAKEWGRILIDGKVPTTVSKPVEPTDGVEIFSDDETTGLPPYIYNVTQNVTDDGKLILEVINLREDGSIDGDAPFGDFIVLRAGLHLYYAKK